jgi:hypothetical protein
MYRRCILALSISLLAPSAWPQMRGGGAHMSAGAAFRGGFVSRGPAFGSFRFGTRFHSGFHGRFFFNPGFHRRRFVSFGFPGYYGYPAYYYGDYSYAPAMYEGYDQSRLYYQQTRELAAELDRLSDEVERLREERQEVISPPSRTERESMAHPPVAEKSEPGEPTVLVFQDKHSQEVHNYAIVGQTLWIFTEQRARKVPLSSVDIEATRKTNEEHGVEFRVPN